MNRDIRKLPLDLIKLDQENVRFGGDFAESQKESLQLLMNDPADAKKLYNLAQDISQYGLDPTELQLVFPDADGHYIVIEGNRRLAAIKLLIKPDLCPIESRVKDFISLKNNSNYKIPNDLDFSYVESREAGDKWIELKHTGENNGIGRVGWDSDIRDERKARLSGFESIGRQLRTLIATNNGIFSNEAIEHSKSISVTNLTRLFQSTPAQNFFQLEVKAKTLTPKYKLEYIAPSVSYALELMSDRKFTVNDIKNGDDRVAFIHKIPANLNPIFIIQEEKNSSSENIGNSDHADSYRPEYENTSQANTDTPDITYPNSHYSDADPHDNQANDEDTDGTTSKKPRARPDRKQRLRIIDWPMQIEPPRINDLFRDLRTRLNVQETPGSVAVVFRVFLEVSCDHYIKDRHENGDPVHTADQKKQPIYGSTSIKLAMKVQAVARHLEDNQKLTKDQAKAVRKRADSPDTMGSIDHLNQFVHGYSAMAVPADLNVIADEYKTFLEKVWE